MSDALFPSGASRDLRASPAETPPAREQSAQGEMLVELLKHFPPPVLAAATEFRRTRDVSTIPVILRGILLHYMPTDLRSRLADSRDDLHFREHLGIDSLTLTEITLLAEDVFQVSFAHDDLRSVQTLDDLRHLVVKRIHAAV